MPERTFDVIVVGAGPAGEVAAGRAAEGGLSVAMVEAELIGGECSFYACMPSKALLRPAQALAEARRVPGAAQAATGTLDVGAVLGRRDEVIHELDDSGQLPWIESRDITLVRGHAELDGERRVRVGDEVLVAERAVIVATGSSAALPPIDGLEDARPWTNREATTAHEVPGRLAVLGGGVAGVELAHVYAALGSAVTLLELEPGLLGREEDFAGEQVADALRELGADVRLGVTITGVQRNGAVTIELEGSDPVEADELLVAAGRRPNTEGLGVESVGLQAGETIEVDDLLRAGGRDWLYAIGDVNGRSLLTHQGKQQARDAVDYLLGRHVPRRGLEGSLSPRVVFTEPQVAAVGHTLASAREAGLTVRAVDVDINANAGASFYGRHVPGTLRLVVEEQRRVLVGATFTGADVAEFLHAATIAVVAEVTLEQLWRAVPSFPTRSEVWLKALEKYGL